MRESKVFTWLFFGATVALFGMVLWARLFATPPRGEWRNQYSGATVGTLPVVDTSGRAVPLTHPAVFYFYSGTCRFCRPAARQITAFVSRNGSTGLPLYALSNYGHVPPWATADFSSAFRLIKLTRTSPNLTFVKELPLLVRTDAEGNIVRAYVGIPADSILVDILTPRAAGPVTR